MDYKLADKTENWRVAAEKLYEIVENIEDLLNKITLPETESLQGYIRKKTQERHFIIYKIES